MTDDWAARDKPIKPEFKLRGKQPEWIEAIERDEKTHARLLAIAPGGIGKSSVMAVLAKRKWEQHGIRTLITENREHLTEQTAERVRDETGLDVDVEMASQFASPHAAVVVASVQSLGRPNRLAGFADNHFGLVVPDECHLSMATQPLRILNYFHYSSASLDPAWVKPKDGEYAPHSVVCGFTASPNIGGKKHLSDFFNKVSVNYPYLDAIEDGWLVGIKEINVPVTIDTRKFRTRKTSEGNDFNTADQSAAIIPVIRELAEQIVRYAHNKKTICFLPSVECSRIMADTLNGMGLRAIFVSGECLDKSEKTKAYNLSGPGTVLVNCALVAYGIDFPDTDCIAPFSAVISKANYVQKIYRGTRVLPGIVSDAMSAEERKAAIAASRKPFLTVLSPFFISDRIDLCELFDLFGEKPAGGSKISKLKDDFTQPAKIRDYIEALRKAADKHAHRQPRTIDPVTFSLRLKINPSYVPENSSDAAPATKEEKDFLLAAKIDSSAIKCSGQAQQIINKIVERDRMGLASAPQLQLLLRLGIPEDQAVRMKKDQAGAVIGRKLGRS